MKPTLDQIMASVNYLPWKTVGKLNGVPYLDLLTDLGIGVMEAAGVKEQLLLLERKGKVTLLCMEPPNSSHIVAIRPRTYTPAHKKIDPKKRGFR